MKRFFSSTIAFAALGFASCSSMNLTSKKADAPVSVAWVFDMQSDAAGLPRGSVFLQVDNERVLVHPNVENNYKLIEPADYARHKVPPEALAACMSYGVGRTEELYVVRDKKQLVVYGRMHDEEGGAGEYRVRQVVPIK